MKYRIKIELLSDTCPSSGGAYGSAVDTDIEYDAYGIPYISAKRIKGCLRETAFLMRDWGLDVPAEKIFGEKGNKRGSLRLGNARVPEYEVYCAEIEEQRNSGLTHPQNVLKFFSYIRTQTAMEGGVAKEGSLRVIRVLKRGLVFTADAFIADSYYSNMKDICRCMRNMGLNRTRGMGEVRVTFEEAGQEERLPEGFDQVEKKLAEERDDRRKYRLDYRLRLREPVILKSPDRGQEKTQDYIEGGKMLGVLAGRIGSRKYRELTEQESIICSNLYVTDAVERYDPAPASLRTLKDDDSGKVCDLAAGFKTGEQTKNLGNAYVRIAEEEIHILNVHTQIKNHHSRPEDKSIGRARGNGEGDFYQMSGIMAGQTFAGYILASSKQMCEILKAMQKMRAFEIGYGNAAEYGNTELYLDGIEACEEQRGSETSQFAVFLASPLILYSEAGMYTQDVNVLAKEISKIVGNKVVPDMEKLYLKYAMTGGWQSMWGKPKQTAWVLDKGTMVIMHTENGEKVKIPEKACFVGERTMEGYGEIVLHTVPKHQILQTVTDTRKSEGTQKAVLWESDLTKYLREKEEEKALKKAGRETARKVLEKNTCSKNESAATVNKLLLTLGEQRTEDKFCEVIQSIQNDAKKKFAESIGETIDKNIEGYAYTKRQKAFEIYMRSFLLEAKYRLRKKEGGKTR